MIITHQGVAPKEKPFEATCHNCGTVVKFTRDDPAVKFSNIPTRIREPNDHTGPDADERADYTCPICDEPATGYYWSRNRF